MSHPQNPFGLHTITPYLIVHEAERLIKFLQDVFNGEIRGSVHYRADKTVQHAEIKLGDSVIMLGEPMPDNPNVETTANGLYVYVDDCDKTFNEAIAAGAKLVLEPKDYPHGDRYGGVRDYAGNVWWIVTHIAKQ